MPVRSPGQDGDPPPGEGEIVAERTRLGYLRAGTGEHPVVLLHGWPQTSHAWRRVLPLLEAFCSAVALDLPGVGRSSPQAGGFDKATMAGDVHAALENLGMRRPMLVGHDIGALVGYALARHYPSAVSGLVIVDTPLPGIAGWEETTASSAYWHLGFHCDIDRGQPTAEALVDGRQTAYFRSFIDRFAAYPDTISDTDIAVYACGYDGPMRLTAGFSMFRTFPLDIADNQINSELAVPILAVFSEFCHATVLDTVADGLRQAGAADVRTAVLRDCGHWPAEEQPAALAQTLNDFASSLWTP